MSTSKVLPAPLLLRLFLLPRRWIGETRVVTMADRKGEFIGFHGRCGVRDAGLTRASLEIRADRPGHCAPGSGVRLGAICHVNHVERLRFARGRTCGTPSLRV